MNKSVIVGFDTQAAELSRMLVSVNPGLVTLDLHQVIMHQVDCYLYGGLFREFTKDPLLQTLNTFNVPPMVASQIAAYAIESVQAAIDETIGKPQNHLTYFVNWLSPFSCLIEVSTKNPITFSKGPDIMYDTAYPEFHHV